MGLSQSFKRRKEPHYVSPGSGLPQPAGAISDMLVSKPFRGDPRNYENCQQGRGSTHPTEAGWGQHSTGPTATLGFALLWVSLMSAWRPKFKSKCLIQGLPCWPHKASQLTTHHSALPAQSHVFLPLRAACTAPPRVTHSWGPAHRLCDPLLALSVSLYWTNPYVSLEK